MSILNQQYTYSDICNNQVKKIDSDGNEYTTFEPVPYRWCHGATDTNLGDGIIIYAIIQSMRFKNCVCLGSGGGFIPRIMTQARVDLHSQGIFKGSKDNNFGDIGFTYLVDAANGVGGNIDYEDKDSFFRQRYEPRFIKDTTENAFYNFFAKKDIKIDLLHIDAGHSYEDVKKDFELYSTLLNKDGIITIHDTDEKYQKEFIVTEDEKEYFQAWDGPSKFIKELGPEWKQFNFFNTSREPHKPTSTGLTILQHA